MLLASLWHGPGWVEVGAGRRERQVAQLITTRDPEGATWRAAARLTARQGRPSRAVCAYGPARVLSQPLSTCHCIAPDGGIPTRKKGGVERCRTTAELPSQLVPFLASGTLGEFLHLSEPQLLVCKVGIIRLLLTGCRRANGGTFLNLLVRTSIVVQPVTDRDTLPQQVC